VGEKQSAGARGDRLRSRKELGLLEEIRGGTAAGMAKLGAGHPRGAPKGHAEEISIWGGHKRPRRLRDWILPGFGVKPMDGGHYTDERGAVDGGRSVGTIGSNRRQRGDDSGYRRVFRKPRAIGKSQGFRRKAVIGEPIRGGAWRPSFRTNSGTPRALRQESFGEDRENASG